jgi:predicted glutamine amidotransferase
MCRMLGIVASEATSFRFCLHQAPRSLHCLSREHPDGWGIAVYESGADRWNVQKQPACAGDDERFVDVAVTSRGHSMVAHIRKGTVGPIGIDNTHPFHRGRWVFAHNGTIEDVDTLRRKTSPGRLAEITGSTDSEVLFAYLLTCVDDVGRAETARPDDVESALVRAVRGLRHGAASEASNFLLSDGEQLYAFRRGRSLFTLERRPSDEVRPSRRSPETGATIDTTWTARQQAVLVASEAITDEPWLPVEEGSLLAVRRHPAPHVRVIATPSA